METVKKKRGRKPKETTIINNNPIFADDNDNIDNLIIKLNYNTNNSITHDIEELEDNLPNLKLSNISEVCWNCCHKFHSCIVGLPIKYENNIFNTIGDFCSLECAYRYAYEYHKDNIHEIINIINLYNNKKKNVTTNVKMAPPKTILKMFGGDLSIDEYRKNNSYYSINIPISIPVNINIERFDNNKNNVSELKIYRKNDINKNNKMIFNKLCQIKEGL
tara:strand:- start:94 stop:750 length:657 start_codon:yes stop_codon:yes gene_type:complete